MTSKMTSDLKLDSIVRLRRMMHTPIERLALGTDLVYSGQQARPKTDWFSQETFST